MKSIVKCLGTAALVALPSCKSVTAPVAGSNWGVGTTWMHCTNLHDPASTAEEIAWARETLALRKQTCPEGPDWASVYEGRIADAKRIRDSRTAGRYVEVTVNGETKTCIQNGDDVEC